MEENKLNKLKQKREILQQKLADPQEIRDASKLKEISMEFSKIEKEIACGERLEKIERDIASANQFLLQGDYDLRKEAEAEIKRLETEREALESKSNGEEETLTRDLIMEIRAGAGGDEAGLFALRLFQMYARFAAKKGWKVVPLSESKNDVGGYKEVVFEINGNGAFKFLRNESGVHRVQRIPETEKTGRVHTSTASVAVLPKAREIDVEIKPQDIKVEFFRSSGPGGQNVNKVETAVRVYHLPSGFIVTSQDSRSQQKNREQALTHLRSKLLDSKLREEAKKMAAERKQQIGTGDRSEKIRTYNFPQDRVTDHRVKESWHNIESIMEGNIEQIAEALLNRNL